MTKPRYIHYVNNEYLIGSRGNALYKSYDGGRKWSYWFSIPIGLKVKLGLCSVTLSRLLRTRIYHVFPLSESLIVFAFGEVYNYNMVSEKLISIGKVKGSRPLCIGHFENTLYFGEYFSNPDRTIVNVLKLGEGLSRMETIFSFDDIRHVHGIFYDHFDNCFWISTGDYGDEACIWRSDFSFNHVEAFLRGTQQDRAVQVLIDKDYIYYGTDTQLEQNYIYRVDKRSKEKTMLSAVEGSVLSGAKIGGAYFFATAVEPSKVNSSKNVVVWYSKGGEKWTRLKVFYKDKLNMTYFQFGYVVFPYYNSDDSTSIYFTPFACVEPQEYHQYILTQLD